MRSAVRTLALPDARISFWDDGDGEPVVLVHAGLCADWFVAVAAELTDYRVIRTHRAGYGLSTDLTGGLGVADHARHLAEVVRSLGVPRAHWVGHSSGASVALQVASAYPELVGSLVLLEAARPAAPDEPRNAGVVQSVRAAAAGRFDEAFDGLLGAVSGPDCREAIVRWLGQDGLAAAVRSSEYMFGQELPALNAWRFDAADIAAVTRPVLLVEGQHSQRFTPMYAVRNDHLARHLPDAERLVLPAVSHAMPLQDPAGVALAIEDFTGKHPLAA